EGSTFVNRTLRFGIYTLSRLAEDTVIENNTFERSGISYTGGVISGTQADGAIIRGNQISVDSGPICGGGGAINVQSMEGDILVEDNEIVTNSGGITARLFTADLPDSLLIRNNTVLQTADACREAVVLGTANIDFAHNTVVSTSDTYAAVEMRASDGIGLHHNVLISTANRAVQVDVGANLPASSTNALWADGPVFASWEGTDVADLAALQTTSGGAFAGSVETRPTFVDEASGDLRLPAFDGDLQVSPLAAVPDDIDGTLRSDPTQMGAHHLDIPDLAVGVRALLQGAYSTAPTVDGTPDPMRTVLAASGAIPLDQPYDNAFFDGLPAECDVTGVLMAVPADVVDWVVVALREEPAGPDLVCQPALLREDGIVLGLNGAPGLTFLAMAPGDYHVVVYHRNHLAAMPATPAALSETNTNVDLAGAAHYGGGGLLVEPGLRALRSGDGDGDGSVLAPDQQTVWLPSVGQTGYLRSDFNLDGSVLADDQQVFWLPNVGLQSGVPGASSLTSGAPASAREAGPSPEARSAPATRASPEARRE
ncbi:MAG: hypothetical protein AAFQ43_07265, partial [Bacteroidota bacterium]